MEILNQSLGEIVLTLLKLLGVIAAVSVGVLTMWFLIKSFQEKRKSKK